MPNIKSATKRMELSRKWADANRKKRSRLRTAIKRVRAASSTEEGRERLREATVLIDRAAGKRLLPPKRADRIKSRLSKLVESLG
jgi:small subunit ribosomal protein S20